MRVVIAGGGTGGHLFPGIAVAEEFLKRDSENRVLFIGTKKGIEHRMLRDLGYELQEIEVEGVKGRGIRALIKGVYAVPKSMWQSRAIFKRFAPDVILGVGGYASGPAVIAAWCMGRPTAIAEQNAVAGNTNRILGRFVDRIFLTYEESKEGFAPRKVMVTGNPVRAAFAEGQNRPTKDSGIRQLLIFGGSQGAAAINKAVVEMLPLLRRMSDRIRVVHQTGERDGEMVRRAYGEYGLDAVVSPFIKDMASAYGAADLIICRAGATSLAEITAAGRACVLIPFPWAVGDHQTKNAEAMVRAGAAVMIRESGLSAATLFACVESLLVDEDKLRAMEERSKRLGRPDAAARVVDACTALAAMKH
jgi:UDP-N-acetylglucosamine--N-acetylmuramyl-(pentapeptide) pyrophosphoryl-undecaprenol N-acetylglucosamine transferase